MTVEGAYEHDGGGAAGGRRKEGSSVQTEWRRASVRSSVSWLRCSTSTSMEEALLLNGHGASIVAVLQGTVWCAKASRAPPSLPTLALAEKLTLVASMLACGCLPRPSSAA